MKTTDDGVKFFNNREPVLLSEIIYDELNINDLDFQNLVKFGAIYVNNQRQTKDRWILHVGAAFRVHTRPRRYYCDYDWKSLLVFENDFFLVLNKPSGLPSHPSVDNQIEDALTQTSFALKTPLFVTHRLDTLTSGLIVYAKKRQFVKEFNLQLIERRIEKKYVAIVEVSPESTIKHGGSFARTLIHWMNPAPGTPKKLSAELIEGWDICKLEILEGKKIAQDKAQILMQLLTGRTHQIRAQMSFFRAPIWGDLLYGSQMEFKKNAIALKAYHLEFDFENQRMQFTLDASFE
jgi:23S rRNA pseudouridine1911/1915/1917 synthase